MDLREAHVSSRSWQLCANNQYGDNEGQHRPGIGDIRSLSHDCGEFSCVNEGPSNVPRSRTRKVEAGLC